MDGPVGADCAAVGAEPGPGLATELTTVPSVFATGVVTDWTTPETPVTVDVTPASSGGPGLVAALACAAGTARRKAVPPVAIANPATWRTVRRVPCFDTRQLQSSRNSRLPYGCRAVGVT